MRSPKDKYSATITFSKYVEGIGQSVTVTGNSIQEINDLALSYKKFGAYIVVRENKSEYPKFNWEVIKEYEL